MGSSKMSEMAMSMVVVMLVLLQLLVIANGNDPPQCNLDQKPSCPPKPNGLLGHIVLLHGAGQGQWYWYKVKPMLEAAGYFVTILQLGPSVTMDPKSIENVNFWSYSDPLFQLMKCIEHKVLLVGHSAGGFAIGVAMEKYPEKVHAGVFIAAYMPDTAHNMAYVLQQQGIKYPTNWLDTCIKTSGSTTWFFFGAEFLRSQLYQMCPPEDIALMYTQKRPGSFFDNEIAEIQLTEGRYGSVDRFYIVAGDDLAIATDYQHEMIANYPVKEERMINSSGHEVMLSKPLELSANILHFARQYHHSFEITNAAGDGTQASLVEKKTKPNSIRRGAWWA